MKLKIITVLLLSVFFTNSVYALTNAEIDFLVAGGFIAPDKVAAARSVASDSSSKSSTTTSTPKHDYFSKSRSTESSTCLRLNSDLFSGMSGDVVSKLQSFLKSQNHFNEDVTGYFGKITQSAVENFQKAQGIVLNGTPETTGFGKVGPATRSAIEKLSCVNSGSATDTTTADFFGYNLNELFNYNVDTEFSQDFNYDANFAYESYLDYADGLNYSSDFDYDADINYDIDDYDADFGYKADTSYNVDFGSGDNKDVSALLFVKAVNGEHLRGGNKVPVAVSSKNVELKWTSKNATSCSLSGDFKEKSLSVPVNGTANLVLTNATDVASNGDPMYAFKIYCFSNSSGYVFPGADTALIWVAPATTTASTTSAQ